MPSRTLPTFTRAEVEEHNTRDSLWVTIGSKVFDVTDFLQDHPGGPELIEQYAGKDVSAILKDEVSHAHSDSAYEILDESLVGFIDTGKSPANGSANGSANGASNVSADGKPAVDKNGNPIHPRTGMSCEEDLSRETDIAADYKTHKFLDLSRPLFPQVFFGGFDKEFYLDQVHRPRHYRGGASAPLFGNFLEPLSKTPWWVVPTLWVPFVAYGTILASEGFENKVSQAAYWLGGVAIWSFVEYLMHRFLFHLDDFLPNNRYFITLHFLLHGIHHYLPMDRYRLVMPPALFVILAYPFWHLAHAIFFYSWHAATTVYCGGVFGYILYDMTHYFLHHQNLPLWYKELKKYHLQHHFLDYELGFGVTSRFWDRVFGTELVPVVKTA